MSELVELHGHPPLSSPVMILALEGWIDAGMAANGAMTAIIEGIDTDHPSVTFSQSGQTHRLEADFIAGCDGSQGICRTLPPSGALTRFVRSYPMAWLGILARTAPVTADGMYCVHPEGLSLHSMRGTEITRQYLQVPADTDPRDLGWKTLAVNVSDLAAMGATPRWVVLAASLPAADEAWVAAFAEGFFACSKVASKADCSAGYFSRTIVEKRSLPQRTRGWVCWAERC